MRLPMMNIEHIAWSAFPKEQWTSLLNNISVGHYVYTLPVPVSDRAEEMVFPVGRLVITRSGIDLGEIRFKRESYTDGIDTVNVWRRIA